MVPSLFHPPQWGIWGGSPPGGALFPHLTAPSPSAPPRLPSTTSAPTTTSAPPNLGTNSPPTPIPWLPESRSHLPTSPSPPGDLRQPPPSVGTPPGAGGSRELALGARGPGAAAGASSGAISRFLAGPGAEQMEAPPHSLQARLRATAGSPHPKNPHPGVTKGRGGSHRLLVLGSSLLGRPQGTNPANAAPSPPGHLSWRRLLVLRCAPRSRFGAIWGLFLPLLGSPHRMAAPLARCAPTHAGLCMGSPWPLQQCHPHHIWEPGPKTAPGGGFSTPSPMRCPSLYSGATAHI